MEEAVPVATEIAAIAEKDTHHHRAAELARTYRAPSLQTPGVLQAAPPDRRIVLRDPAPERVLLEAYGVQ